VRSILITVVGKGRQNRNILTNMDHLPAEDNFFDDHVDAYKPVVV